MRIKRKILGLSLVNALNEIKDQCVDEAQEPETDKGSDPQLWIQDPAPEHDEELVKVATPQGWNRGNKSRSHLAVNRHAGNMNRRGVYPDAQKDLGWGDSNERTDEQMD